MNCKIEFHKERNFLYDLSAWTVDKLLLYFNIIENFDQASGETSML